MNQAMASSQSPRREILHKSERWVGSPNSPEHRWTGVDVTYRDTATGLVHAVFLPGVRLLGREMDDLDNTLDRVANSTTVIPASTYAPLFTAGSGITRAPEPLPGGAWIKRPSYSTPQQPYPNWAADNLLRQIQVWELLAKHPHPNIPRYLGCQVSSDGGDGRERITGIVLEGFETSLQREFNPRSFSKKHARELLSQTAGNFRRALDGVESAVRHLHSLGWVHRNIGPPNVLLRRQGPGGQWEGFLTGMGACARIGSRIKDQASDIGFQYTEWHDEEHEDEIALPENDFEQVNEIRVMLSGDSSLPFKFLTFNA